MAGVDGGGRRGRVVLFPLPLQGHLTPVLQLADVLHRRGVAATILHATFNAPNPAAHPHLTFVPVPLGVREKGPGIAMILSVNAAIEASRGVRDALASLLTQEPRPSCIVIDALLPAVQKAAAEVGLPTMVLHTESAASVRSPRANTMLHEKGNMSAKDNLGIQTTANSSGILINTFEALEAADLKAIRDELAIDGIKVFATGPLHKLSSIGGTSSLLEQDRSCIEWLDTRAAGSVLYVGLGFSLQGKFERGAIERAIARLMEDDLGAEIRGRARDLKNKAMMCLAEGGSTQRAVDELIDHLLSL